MSLNVVTFSEVCGENVKITDDNTLATWTPKNSGGWACSDQEVQPGDTVEVKVEGSGRCDIGFMSKEQSPKTFKTLNEVRAHRKSCSIPVTFRENGEEITSSFDDKSFKRRAEKGIKIWIAVFIRYGNMTVELISNESSNSSLKFSSDSHGPNILLDSDNTKAYSNRKSPASVCVLSERLKIGGKIRLKCASENEGGREISRYELKLQVSDKSPDDLKNEFRYLFEASETKTSDSQLTTVEIIEKDECNGDIIVSLSREKGIQYKTAKGKQNAQPLSFSVENGVWVVLDLYGVSVSVTTDVDDDSEDNQQGEDQPDSVPIKPCGQVIYVPPESLNEPGQNTGGSREPDSNRGGTGADQASAVQPNQQLPRYDSNMGAVGGACINETGEKLNLQKHFPYLVQEIETNEFCDHLHAKEILTFPQMDHIHTIFKNSSAASANRELLKILKKKKILKSDMKEILEAIGQGHLLEKFYPKEETQEKK